MIGWLYICMHFFFFLAKAIYTNTAHHHVVGLDNITKDAG